MYAKLHYNSIYIFSGTHGSINGLAQSRSIPSVLLSCVSSSVHSLGHLLPTGIKLRMAKECCAGAAYLHSKSIMHCDIKSLNFLGKKSFHLSFIMGFIMKYFIP